MQLVILTVTAFMVVSFCFKRQFPIILFQYQNNAKGKPRYNLRSQIQCKNRIIIKSSFSELFILKRKSDSFGESSQSSNECNN